MTHPLKELFTFVTPYRARLALAVAGMLVYAVGSAGLAALVKPILDNVLVNQDRLVFTAWALVGVYLLKGIGSYVSSYLMADVGLRVVTDLRNALYRHVLGPVGWLLCASDHGPAAVAHHQRCQPGPAGSVGNGR